LLFAYFSEKQVLSSCSLMQRSKKRLLIKYSPHAANRNAGLRPDPGWQSRSGQRADPAFRFAL
jgi:hypothetical protein